MQHIEGQDRDQLLPLPLDQMVQPEAFTWVTKPSLMPNILKLMEIEALSFLNRENVSVEVLLMFTAYNLRETLSIASFQELIGRLKALFSTFWLNLTPSCSMDHMEM